MFGQKRSHSPDGYEDNNFRQGPFQPQFGGRGGYQGGAPYGHQQHYGGHQGFHKRQRGDQFQQAITIEEKIARLGETGSRTSDIGNVAKDIDADLINKGQDEERIRQLTTRICKSIVSFPTRTGTYATLIGLISVKHYNVACQVIQTLHASYPIYLEAQRWDEALTIIHLLSSLVNCNIIRPSALLSQFEFLLESTLEDNIPQARSDYFVYTVLSSLPYVALELSQQEESKDNFERMLTTIETYLSKRSKEHLNVMRVWISSDSTIQMDYLDSLWVQIKNFRANNWTETYLFRPYNEKEIKDTMASSLIPTNSPTFQIPGHSDKYLYPSPRIVFHIFEDDIVEKQIPMPGSDKIERFCIENNIRNIIDECASEPKTCARHLAHMLRSDQLPLRHLFIETIIGELFRLPLPKHDELLYQTLLFEFTRIFYISQKPEELKDNYDVILNKGVKALFDNLDTMNVTYVTRFVRWFSYHLNNINYIYPWQAWTDANNQESNSPKAVFVHDILSRCIRFCYRDKIEQIVQENLKSLMPQQPTVNFQPVFIDNPKANEMIATIREMIANRVGGVEICTKLNIKIESVVLPEDFVIKEEKLADQLLKVDVFSAVLLDMAQRSLTHISSALGKYRNVLKALLQVPQGQAQLLQTLESCLHTHPQLHVILIDKLLKADLVEAKEICNWIFSESMKQNHVRSYTWEILDNTISRVEQNIENLVAERLRLQEDETKKKEEKSKKDNDGSGTPNPDDDGDENNVGSAENNGTVIKMEVSEDTEEQKKQALKEELGKFDLRIRESRKYLRDLIVQIFSMFASALGEHIRKCELEQKSFIDCTYRWLSGRMQEVFYNHYRTTGPLIDEIKGIVDSTPTIGGLIINLNQ